MKSFFEQIHIIKSISYEAYWFVFGIILLFAGDIGIIIFEEKSFPIAQILSCIFIAVAPILHKLYLNYFINASKNLNVIFEMKGDVWENWIYRQYESIFTLKSKNAKLIVASIVIASMITIARLPPFFNTPLLVFFTYFKVFFVSLFGALILQFSVFLLFFLRKLTFLPVVARFYLFPHPELTKLQRFYSSLSIIIALGYLGLVFVIWFGPYGFNKQMIGWLSVMATLPITLFIWSYYHIHLIQHNIKYSFISQINEQVNFSLKSTIEGRDAESIEKLEKFMSIQAKLHALKEYPFEITGLITFVATTAITIIQVILALRKN